jgi:hypothetical protein
MELNWQYIVAGLLLILAAIYVFRSVKRSVTAKHDCPDCGIPVQKKPKQHLKPE